MALKATIFRAELAVADMDRGYFATHALTLARHPALNIHALTGRQARQNVSPAPDCAPF